jgi:hypothetical protein
LERPATPTSSFFASGGAVAKSPRLQLFSPQHSQTIQSPTQPPPLKDHHFTCVHTAHNPKIAKMPQPSDAIESAHPMVEASHAPHQPLPPVQRILLIAFAVLSTIFCIIPLRNQLRHGSTKDYPLWLDTGARELHGQTPYYFDPVHHEFPFMYPPGAAGLLAPASIAGKLPLMVLLVMLNTAAWATAILVPVSLLGGPLRTRPAILFWLPTLVCILYVIDTYLEGQVALVLLACLLGMLWCLRRRRPAGAGFLLALAASIKAFPILAAPYLIYRRQWKALGCAAIFLAILLLALPACFRGPAGALADLRTWSLGMPSNYTPDMIGQRKERSYTWQNGSLISVANRLLRPVIADRDPEWHTPPLRVNLANLSFHTVNIVIVAVGLCLCLAYLAVMPKQSVRTPFTDAAETAMLLILIIIFTPLSFTYNNAWLMPAIVVILYWLTTVQRSQIQRTIGIVWLAAGLALLICTIRIPALRTLRAVGNTFWADLLLLAELAWILIQQRRLPQPHPNQGAVAM